MTTKVPSSMTNAGGVDVLAFGADPNFTNDSTTAINNAVAALVALGGGNLIYPPGKFKTTASINDVAKVYHVGAGIDATVIQGTGNYPVFARAGSATVTVNSGGIKDMTIRGAWSSSAPGANPLSYGISCVGSNGAVYERLRIFSCAVCFYAAFNYESYCYSIDVLGGGTDQSNIGFVFDYVQATGNVNNAMFMTNCVASFTYGDGWQLRNCNGSLFTSCTAEACGGYGWNIGFTATGVLNPQFTQWTNCIGDSNTNGNWLIEGTVALPAQDYQFSNCWSGNSGTHGWQLLNCKNMEFGSCSDFSANYSGVYLVGNDNVDIIGMVVAGANRSNGGYSGINLQNTNNCQINDCDVSILHGTGSGPYSIAENGTSNFNVVMGNKMPQRGQQLGANSMFRNNQGFVTETAGLSTFTSGVTALTVTTDVNVTPVQGEITLTPSGNFNAWVSSISGNQFTLNIPSQGSTVSVGWKITATGH